MLLHVNFNSMPSSLALAQGCDDSISLPRPILPPLEHPISAHTQILCNLCQPMPLSRSMLSSFLLVR